MLRPRGGLDVIASFSARRLRDFEDRVVGTRLAPALDVFYQFTPELTGAVTLNTDFSTAEVDHREVKLTRFDLFFPEKRDFFLQDAKCGDGIRPGERRWPGPTIASTPR